jgi:hypothetical protein
MWQFGGVLEFWNELPSSQGHVIRQLSAALLSERPLIALPPRKRFDTSGLHERKHYREFNAVYY